MADLRTHRLDPISLVAGVLALSLATLYLLDDLGAARVDEAVVAATAVVVVGLVGLVITLRRLLRGPADS